MIWSLQEPSNLFLRIVTVIVRREPRARRDVQVCLWRRLVLLTHCRMSEVVRVLLPLRCLFLFNGPFCETLRVHAQVRVLVVLGERDEE